MGVWLLPALEAHKKPLKWPFRGFRGLEGFRPGKRQAWTPIKSHGCGLLPALEAHKKPLKWPFRGFRGLEGFKAWQTASLDAHKKPWMWAFACAGSP